MSDGTSLGDRMKGYEAAVGSKVLRRTPVIIRVDGKAFHTFTKRITKAIEPETEFHFSKKLHHVMMNTALSMMWNTQNSMVAYTQSDEISVLLNDWRTLEAEQWFDGNVQKIVSVSSAMATAYFNHFWNFEFNTKYLQHEWNKLALFDARVYNVPPDDVVNYFLWRQRDATRNSVNFIARKFCSHKSLHGLNGLEIKNKLLLEHGVQWDEYPFWEQRGACVVRNPKTSDVSSRAPYEIDDNIPLFGENREYIANFLKEKEQDV